MSPKEHCLTLLSGIDQSNLNQMRGHIAEIRKLHPCSALKLVNTAAEYLTVKAWICDSSIPPAEALYLFSIGEDQPLKCQCGRLRSYTVSGVSEYPRQVCGKCSKINSAARLAHHNVTTMINGEPKSSHMAKKAGNTKRQIDQNGLSGWDKISIKSGPKKAVSMAKYCQDRKTADSEEVSFLYIVHDVDVNLFKIGYSKNYASRFKDISSTLSGGMKVLFLGSSTLKIVHTLERNLHDYFDNERCARNKKIAGRTEWFDPVIRQELDVILEDLHPHLTSHFKDLKNGFTIS